MFRLRESFELYRNVGKNLFVVESYLIDEERKEGEGGTRASGTWRQLWRKDHRERNDMMYPGQSDEPVWQVGYIRLCSLTNSVSSKREIKLSTASHCLFNQIIPLSFFWQNDFLLRGWGTPPFPLSLFW